MKAHVEDAQLLLVPRRIPHRLGSVDRLLHKRDMVALRRDGLPSVQLRVQIRQEELNGWFPLGKHLPVEHLLEYGRGATGARASIDKVILTRVRRQVFSDDLADLGGRGLGPVETDGAPDSGEGAVSVLS